MVTSDRSNIKPGHNLFKLWGESASVYRCSSLLIKSFQQPEQLFYSAVNSLNGAFYS